MASALELVNGVARMVVQQSNVIAFSEGYAADGTELSSPIPIPNDKAITIGDELAFKLFLNGQYLERTIDYLLIQDPGNTLPGLLNAVILQSHSLVLGERLQFIGLEEAALVYDVTTSSLSLIAGNAFTLPNAETYKSTELEVYLNGQLLENLIDYNYVGSIPRTQVTFTFDILTTDRLRFRKDIS